MKRDARIGLAVVLVLGLAVTLLIGRALVKRGGELAEDMDGAGGPAQYSADAAHVDGAPAANISTPSNTPIIEGAETSARQPEANPAVRQFVDDQTRRLGVENSPANPNPLPPSGLNRAPTVEGSVTGPTRPIAGPIGSEAPAPKNDHSLLLDHENSGPTSSEAQPPSDGYGYTVTAGDNMWKISSKVYGDGKYTQKIVDANPTLNAAKMKAGAVIKIPIIQNKTVLMKLPSFADASAAKASGGSAIAAKDAKKEKAAEPVAASSKTKAPEAVVGEAASEATTHKVEAGETLGVIAQKFYGSSGPKSVGRILAANKGLDPAKLKVGQELQIPAKK